MYCAPHKVYFTECNGTSIYYRSPGLHVHFSDPISGGQGRMGLRRIFTYNKQLIDMTIIVSITVSNAKLIWYHSNFKFRSAHIICTWFSIFTRV